MIETPETRQRNLHVIKNLLSTRDGEVLMDELAVVWNPYSLMGDDPQKTAYNVGLRDAYEFLKALQTGELIHE